MKEIIALFVKSEYNTPMPILQYHCPKCDKRFEELVKNHEEEVFCPACGGRAERCYAGTVYSSTGKPVKKCSGKCSECDGCG